MIAKRKTTRPATARRKVKAKFPDPADQEKAEAMAELALRPSVHGAVVAHEYMKSTFGDLDLGELAACLSEGANDIWVGDMKRAEAMLYGQANALQAIFTNLARRANSQEYLKHMETYLRLALKAQSQCRATLETLATIKAGPAIFARQANIAHGPQQVNNGVTGHELAGTSDERAGTSARARESDSSKSGLLGVSDGERLDTGAARTTGRGNTALEAVGTIDGTTNRRG